MKYEERRASVCAYLRNSIVIFEISQVSADDCLAAFYCSIGKRVTHLPKEQENYNIFISPKTGISRRGEGGRFAPDGTVAKTREMPMLRTVR